ncbi:MAG: hypothetical protein Q9214_000273 [Letrouitia sp. 1 TL-2023]
MTNQGGAFGENLASGYLNVTAGIEGWGNERGKYDFSDPHFSKETGHFTQLVWKATISLGCGRQECGQASGRNQAKGTAPGWFLVCEYWPPGNVNSKEQFSQNVQKQVSRESAAARSAAEWMLALMILGTAVGFTQDVSFISTAELRQLGHRLALRGISAPEDVMSALHNTIHARTEISEYFSRLGNAEENASNKAHKHFTAVLKQIYNDLRARKTLVKLGAITPPASPPSRSSNLFEHLERADCVGDDECFFLSQQDQFDLLDELGCSCCPREPDKHDDLIGQYMAIQLDDLLDSVKAMWSQAATKAVPVIVASAITNTAYRLARNYENDLREYGLDDPDSLRDRYRKCVDSLGLNETKQPPEQGPAPKVSKAGKHISLQGAWEALRDYGYRSKDSTIKTCSRSSANNQPCNADQTCAVLIDSPFNFTPNAEEVSIQSLESDRAEIDLLLERMRLVCSNTMLTTELQTFLQIPIMQDFKLYLDDVDEGTAEVEKKTSQHRYTLTLLFGLRTMMESYKVYTFALTKRASAPNPQTCHTSATNHKCRTDALMFTNDIFRCIE